MLLYKKDNCKKSVETYSNHSNMANFINDTQDGMLWNFAVNNIKNRIHAYIIPTKIRASQIPFVE